MVVKAEPAGVVRQDMLFSFRRVYRQRYMRWLCIYIVSIVIGVKWTQKSVFGRKFFAPVFSGCYDLLEFVHLFAAKR